MADTAIFWFRRDLRLADNTGLLRALAEGASVQPVFIFDTTILAGLPRQDRRVDFIHRSLQALHETLQACGGGLRVVHGDPVRELPALAKALKADVVYCNDDYEPAAVARDDAVETALNAMDVRFERSKDAVVFARDEVLTQQRKPYTVFTPYRKAWFARLKAEPLADLDTLRAEPVAALRKRLAPSRGEPLPSLADLGFETTDLDALGVVAGTVGAQAALRQFLEHAIGEYPTDRDIPGTEGTSRLSLHNRFGTISIRRLVAEAQAHAHDNPRHAEACTTWISELAWRDFFFQILHHHPHVAEGPFKTVYEHLAWENDDDLFAAWCEGRTGYPIVDAAMRQLVDTGFMHNRLRMVAASFLTKDLLIDWRRGEAFFALHLLDYELACNNGNWQWAASTGCDPQPYFRIFNPARQSERFDPEARFIHAYLPALRAVPADYLHEPAKHAKVLARHGVVLGKDYPEPVVEHAERARRAVRLFELARQSAE